MESSPSEKKRVSHAVHSSTSAFYRLSALIVDKLKPEYEGGPYWLMASGVVRIIVLLLASLGTQRISQPDMALWLLTGLFLAALACSVWFLITVRFQRTASPTLIWTQVLLDFSIVAATLSYTGGWSSYFSFLFVVVILEAGMLMGFFHGFVFALLAMGYTFFLQTPEPFKDLQMLPSWYTLMLQMTALFLTALISGHWNERINRLKHFQREILDNMVSGFLFCDLDGRISIANKAACTILDMTESELVGRNTSDTPLSGTGEECPVAIALRTGRDYVNYEYMVETAQKSNQVIELTTHKMLNRKHRIQALIVTFQDITEITEMRLTLQRHDRLAAVGESATELTHEIRNPLTSLQSAVEELQSNLSDTSLTQRLCGIVLRESRHLNSIVTSFLDFSRNPEMKREKIEVSPFLDAIRSSLMKRYPKIEVKVIREDGPSYIQADPVQMRQLCDNILTNSVESMEGQGLIEIEVSDREQLVELAFHDTGCGIAPDTIPHLFDPFYTAKKQGIGMGLAVCLRIVTAHDGDIQAVPRTGGGTSIIVRLPRRSE